MTTDAIDTTGVTLLIINAAWYQGTTPNGTISDSKSNSWTALTRQSDGTYVGNRLFYCVAPTVGSGHTFSYDGTGIFPSIQVDGWSGQGASPFDQQNGGAANAVSTLGTGSVTPSEDNELVVAGLAHENNSGGAVSIGGAFTISNAQAYSGGNSEGGALAYRVQTSATAANPTWDITNSALGVAATIATFKAEAPVGQAGAETLGLAPKRTFSDQLILGGGGTLGG